MHNTPKRIVAVLLSVIMALSVFSGMTFTASAITYSGACGENLTWTLTDGVLTISGSGDMYGWWGYNTNPWVDFRYKDIQHVVIEEGVTSIGGCAFCVCYELESVTIADTVKSIGFEAFYNCPILQSINIPDSVEVISRQAFGYDRSLTNLHIPNSVRSIEGTGEEGAFVGCTGLAYLCSDTVDGAAKAYCDANGITFRPCSGRCGENLSWHFDHTDGTMSISGTGAMYNYSTDNPAPWNSWAVEGDIVLPQGITHIGDYAFFWLHHITGITIPSGTTSIGAHAFEHCWNISSVTIPASMTSIGEYAFCDCSALTDIRISNGLTSIAAHTFDGCLSLSGISIPSSVTSIGEYAFYGCSALADVTLPRGLNSFSAYAFRDCTSLKSITIPDGMISIGEGTFYGSGIENLTIPESVTRIGDYAFCSCSQLTSVHLPVSIGTISNSAFSGCTKLAYICSLPVANSAAKLYCIANGIPFQVCSNQCGENLTWAVDENDVLTVTGTGAMYDYTSGGLAPWSRLNLSGIILGDGITSIGSYAFKGCSSVTDIAVPAGVTSIGASTFENCTGLAGVTIPNSVTSIGANAFYNCTTLTDIILPASITSVGANAFDNCINLTAVQYAGTVADWCGITFGNSAANPLYFAHNLYISGTLVEKLVIPSSVRKIGDYAFYADTSITSVTISEGVMEIGNYAFCNNTSMESVYIPDSVITIGKGAFNTCPSLKSVEYVTGRNEVERSIGELAFAHCDSEDLTNIHIPASVTVIGANAFLGCNSADYSDDFYLCCAATNTVAKEYADNNHIKFVQCNEGANVVAVTFIDGTQVTTIYALKDSKLSQPDTPKRDGFTFRGWRLDGEIYDFNTPVTEEITLYGVWIEGEEAQASAMGGLSVSFEDGLPNGWQIINGVSGNYYWSVSTVDHQSGSHSLFSGTNSSEGDATWFISPKMNLNGQSRALSFAYKNALYNGALSGLDVYYRVNAGEWTRLIHITDAHSAWTTESIVLPPQALAKGVQFGFCATALSDVESESLLGRGVYLDDISVSLFESFENGGVPAGWTTESSPEDTEYIWSVTDPSDANGYIGYCAAWTGTDAAAGNTAWLIMPEMDLREANSLTFSYKNQKTFSSAQNNFGVYYRVNGGAWQELFSTSDSHSDYETETVVLPVGAQNESVQIGFCADIDSESTKKSSKGVYIDGVSLSGNIVSNAESSLNHNVTYSASGNVLTAICSNDPCAFENHTLSLTLLAPEMTQARDGKNPAATLNDLGKFNIELGLSISADDIRYFKGAQQLEAAPTKAGEYTASLTVTADGTEYTITQTYTIERAPHDYEIPTGLAATYGQTLADVILPDGWTWENPSQSVGDVGANAFTALYNNEADEQLTVTVAKAAPSYTLPAGLTATVGQTLADVTLPAGWAWNNPSQSVGEAGARAFAATFTPSDTNNYNTVQMNLAVEVSAATAVEAQDCVSVTIDDKISINFLLDLDARVNPLIVSVDHMTADGQTTLKTQKFLVSYLTKTGDGLYRISFEMAPAQAADRYVISVDGAAIAQDIFSVAEYCYAIRNDPTYGALARATLDYAQAANEVFGYTDVTIADISKMNTDAIGAYTDGVYSDGTGKVSGASFMALTQPEFRFYTSSIAEADAVDYNTAGVTAAYQNGNITDTLNAHFVKNSSGSVMLEVTGVSAEHMNETIIVTVTGLGTITFNGNAFAKSLSNSSRASSRALGAALYNYGEAAHACFS